MNSPPREVRTCRTGNNNLYKFYTHPFAIEFYSVRFTIRDMTVHALLYMSPSQIYSNKRLFDLT